MKTLKSPRAPSRHPRQKPVERQLAEVNHHITELYAWAVASTRRSTDLDQVAPHYRSIDLAAFRAHLRTLCRQYLAKDKA